MKIIIKSFCYNYTIRKYFLCLFITFISIIFLLNFKASLEQKILDLKNSIEENKVIIVELYSESVIDKLKKEKSIEKIQKIDYSYKITFKSFNDINDFEKKYSKYLKNITNVKNNINDNTSIITNINYIINIIIYIIEFAMLLILMLNINQIILETKYDIALYKLVGYKCVDILGSYAIIISIFNIMLYLISLLLNLFLIICLNIIFNIINFDFILFYSYKNFYILVLIILFTIVLTFLKFKKISNISPINLIK